MGMAGQIHTLATLILLKEPPVSVKFVAEWAPEPDWTFWRRYMSLPLPEIETQFLGPTLLCWWNYCWSSNSHNCLPASVSLLWCISYSLHFHILTQDHAASTNRNSYLLCSVISDDNHSVNTPPISITLSSVCIALGHPKHLLSSGSLP